MGRSLASLSVFAFLVIISPARSLAAFTVPELTGPVVDQAGVLNSSTRAALESALMALRNQGGSQINVLTVSSLEGLPIEEASIAVTDKWKLGGKKNDNGVLFLIAPAEHRARIEVGRGNEGTLTDADSKRILDESVIPLFRSGDYDSGTLVGVYQIAHKTDPNIDLTPYLQGHLRRHTQASHGGGPHIWIIVAIILIFLFLSGRGGPYRRSPFFMGGWGGGGGFGGSGGGGGWSGGGGGFSGGGASGGW